MVGHVTSAGRLAVVAVIAGACASTAGLRSAPLDAGETKFYAAPLSVVGPAARQAVLSAGLNVDTVSTPDSLTWMIIANVAVMSVEGGWGTCLFDEQGTGKSLTVVATFDVLETHGCVRRMRVTPTSRLLRGKPEAHVTRAGLQ